MERKNQGITLIALVITIIIMLILAGIVLSLTLGEHGIINRANSASQTYEKAQIKEELEVEIMNIQSRKLEEGKETTREDLLELSNIGASMETIAIPSIGEYKDYLFEVDENYHVTIIEKSQREKPKIMTATAVSSEDGKIRIQIIANIEDGDIQSIQPINESTLVIENSNSNKIYEVTKNGTYQFKVIGTNGSISIARVTVNNSLETIETVSILEGVSKISSSGLKEIKIIENSMKYSVNTIMYEGDIVIDGNMQLVGANLNNSIYEFGDKNDVGTKTEEAKNMVLLKVNGNVTVKEGVTLTSCKSNTGYGGPKGLMIYCTGTFTNNGIVSMTSRGAKATGEDIYLWQNEDGSYEFVPAIGGTGGARKTWQGNVGVSGKNRQTGGGGSGGGYVFNGSPGTAGAGGNGTSYSGGTGGGGSYRYGTGGDGAANGGTGGNAIGQWDGSNGAGGGAGNPGGTSTGGGKQGGNGTGGLLIIYRKKCNK